MNRIRLFLWMTLFISVVLVSCQAQSAPPVVERSSVLLPTLAATAVPASPTPVPSSTPTHLPATAAPTELPITPIATVDLSPGVSLPTLLHVAENTIIEQTGADRREILKIPDVGQIFSLLQVKEDIFLLSAAGLSHADLTQRTFESIFPIEDSMLSGSLDVDRQDRLLIISSLIAGNPIEEGRIHTYDIEQKSLKELMSRPGFGLVPLALDADQWLSYIPRGSDPSFAFIEQINLRTGETSQIFVDSSWDIPTLSPQGRYYMAVGLAPSESPELPNRYGFWLRDLNASSVDQVWIDLPFYPSQPTGLLWSPDETSVYTYLQNAPNDTFQEAYGVWRVDVETRQMEQIADLDGAWLHPHSLSPDGAWILLLPETEPLVYLVHLSTGTVVKQPIPQGGRLIGFKK